MKDQRIFIIGGTGSLGKQLISRFYADNWLAVYSRDEAKHWTIKNELAAKHGKCKVKFFVGDIRDKNRLCEVIRQFSPTVIIAAAALKQVDTCEAFTGESIATNLLGTQNIVSACNEVGTKMGATVLFVSTDKACAPVNVYGMCKSLSERVIISQANNYSIGVSSGFKFMCVRYGNVLESRGSIIPLFRYQAENTSELTVTDPDMTRYVMTLDDSVSLIDYAIDHGDSGDTWIPKLRAMRIGVLAQIFADRYKKKIHVTGIRPGEKKHEDLINESESVRTRDCGSHYVIKSALSPLVQSSQMFTYSSNQNVMSREELESYLTELGIFDCPLDKFQRGASIEEIKK